MITITHPSVICCVCTGFHHSEDCPTAWRFIAECRGMVQYTPVPNPSADDLKAALFMARRQAQLDVEAAIEAERRERLRKGTAERMQAMRARQRALPTDPRNRGRGSEGIRVERLG